jgi:GTP pyrophosphokinase
LLIDLGLGKRIATIVAKRLVKLLAEVGEKPNALLMTRERYTAHESVSQGAVLLDGSENASVKFALCCRPIPGDAVVGYLGRGEGLVVHTAECPVAKRLLYKDSERFITVEWSDEPMRVFETGVVVTVTNGKGVLARVAAVLAVAEADITHVDMGEEPAQDSTDLRFVIAVRDQTHLDSVLRSLKRTPSVLQAVRAVPAS